MQNATHTRIVTIRLKYTCFCLKIHGVFDLIGIEKDIVMLSVQIGFINNVVENKNLDNHMGYSHVQTQL